MELLGHDSDPYLWERLREEAFFVEGGAGVGLEDFGKEAFSFGIPSAVVPLGWNSG